jgi:hypothetical protein
MATMIHCMLMSRNIKVFEIYNGVVMLSTKTLIFILIKTQFLLTTTQQFLNVRTTWYTILSTSYFILVRQINITECNTKTKVVKMREELNWFRQWKMFLNMVMILWIL